jgi:hypothetical protein
MAVQGAGRAIFLSSGQSLSGCESLKKEAGSGAKGRHQVLSRVYKDQGETVSSAPPGPDVGFKEVRSEIAIPRMARARAAAAPPTARPVALTPRRDRRRFRQEKRTTLRLRRNNRAKKGTPRRLISYPFPFFPLSLSLATGTGKGGYPKKDPSL